MILSSVGSTVAIITGVLALVTLFAAAGVGVWRKGRRDYIREENADLRQRNETITRDFTARIDALEARIGSLESDNTLLRAENERVWARASGVGEGVTQVLQTLVAAEHDRHEQHLNQHREMTDLLVRIADSLRRWDGSERRRA